MGGNFFFFFSQCLFLRSFISDSSRTHKALNEILIHEEPRSMKIGDDFKVVDPRDVMRAREQCIRRRTIINY